MTELLTENQTKAIPDLNALLADEVVHMMRTLSFHWNVEGPRFLELHEHFEELYHDSVEFVDKVAERVRIYGAVPLSTMAAFIEEAHLSELDDPKLSPDQMVDKLIEDREHMLQDLRVYIERAGSRSDPTSEDFFVERARNHEVALYKLRSIRRKA